MTESPESLAQYWDMARRRWLLMGSIAGMLVVAALLLAMFWPPTYRSTAMILIVEQEIPADLIRSTITSYADQQIERIKTQVMTRSRLMPIIEEHHLYKEFRAGDTSAAALKRFIADIHIEIINAEVIDRRTGQPTQATIAFTLAYDGSTPEITQKIANELTSLFLSENLKNREQQVHETTAFLKQESEKLANALSQLEENIAAFKDNAHGALPELFQMNMQLLSQVERELIEKNQQMQVQEERIVLLEGELSRYAHSMGERLGIVSIGKQLKGLRSEHASMASYLSPEHPDIMKIKGEIEALEQQGGHPVGTEELSRTLQDEQVKLAGLLERYGTDHPDVVRARATVDLLTKESAVTEGASSVYLEESLDDPAYVSLQAQLASAKAPLEHLRKSKAKLEQQAREYAARVERTPQLEPAYQTLLRDRENTAQKFQEYRSRLLEAQVAGVLESARKGERFSLVEPPMLPESPIRPNRTVIVFLGLVLAMAGGIGSGALAEALDGSIHTADRLREVTKLAPLSVIPYLATAEEMRARGKRHQLVGVGAMVLTVASLGLVHVFLMPLDVLWFVALRKMRLE
ncbi:MAG TPA: hypothetical protein PKK23_09045 [Nitrospirales bacterium]|nr:lipopolysaccharide biosynthesis protein [Nitrospiraceae bacterium]HNP29176.1 hypothetical protein [Nitrospirales bacterium]